MELKPRLFPDTYFFLMYRIIDYKDEMVYNIGWDLESNWIDEDTATSVLSHEALEALTIKAGIEDDEIYNIHHLIGFEEGYYDSVSIDEGTAHILRREHYKGNIDDLPNIPERFFRRG